MLVGILFFELLLEHLQLGEASTDHDALTLR